MRELICFILVNAACDVLASTSFNNERQKIIQDEALLIVGGDTVLSHQENVVNNCLMQHKLQETEDVFDNSQNLKFSQHYFKYKDQIKLSPVYRIIKDMPKGAVLHIHDTGIMGPDYLLNLTYTYQSTLYICYEKHNIHMKFSNKKPRDLCNNRWKLISKARGPPYDEMKVNARLRKRFTLVVDDPSETYPTITDSWGAFTQYFKNTRSILSYRPVREQLLYDSLKLLREHNIMYVEIRTVFPILYDLKKTYSNIETARIFKAVIQRFKNDYPDFFGAKFIYSTQRMISPDTLQRHLQLAKTIKAEILDLFAGFDLVGQEEKGNPLKSFVPQLEQAAKDLNYYLHAGETSRYGTSTDGNLMDAILLGAKRLGHAYALTKHPLLMKKVKENDIGIEVNVISNNVLSLVGDVRNHPLSTFFAQGLPVVLSSDDPGVWESDPISEDFYVAFVGVASRYSDLRLLKTLALNSIKYSALNNNEKAIATNMFDYKWSEFINNFQCSRY